MVLECQSVVAPSLDSGLSTGALLREALSIGCRLNGSEVPLVQNSATNAELSAETQAAISATGAAI